VLSTGFSLSKTFINRYTENFSRLRLYLDSIKSLPLLGRFKNNEM
jgi:hypothetical protein